MTPRLTKLDQRAIALVVNDQIHEDKGARVYLTGPYTIVLHGDRTATCNCAAGIHGRACCHVTATRLLVERERESRHRENETNRITVLDPPTKPGPVAT